MAFASCAHYEEGYYTAYRRMAEDNPGLILFLGDYIYEYGATAGRPRLHAGRTEIVSLADYRRRYAQYKSDPDLQAAHAVAPWIVVPDDHEVENNHAGNIRADSTPALTAAQWTARRTAAYQAYYENMPLRPAQANNGASHPALPAAAVGQARDLPHARHPAVPQRPGVWRRLEGLLGRRPGHRAACRATPRRPGC